jgi:hypothetical protein
VPTEHTQTDRLAERPGTLGPERNFSTRNGNRGAVKLPRQGRDGSPGTSSETTINTRQNIRGTTWPNDSTAETMTAYNDRYPANTLHPLKNRARFWGHREQALAFPCPRGEVGGGNFNFAGGTLTLVLALVGDLGHVSR